MFKGRELITFYNTVEYDNWRKTKKISKNGKLNTIRVLELVLVKKLKNVLKILMIKKW